MIEITATEEIKKSKYIKTKRIHFTDRGKARSWDIIETIDSVASIIVNVQEQHFVLVKQFRLPVFLKNKDGFTYELCAGLMDKDKDPRQTMKEEIFEECGYEVPIENVLQVNEFWSNVGLSAAKQSLFCCEVTENMKTGEGGGVSTENENIEVFYLKFADTEAFIKDQTKIKSTGLCFALNWYLNEVYEGAISSEAL